MRKRVLTLLSVVVVLLMTVVFLPSGVVANNAAVVIRPDPDETSCGMMGVDELFFISHDVQIVETQSSKTNVLFRCKSKGVANSTGSAVVYTSESNPFFSGIMCSVWATSGELLLTTSWQQRVSASGNATLTCHFKTE